jgi:hypothetical protein
VAALGRLERDRVAQIRDDESGLLVEEEREDLSLERLSDPKPDLAPRDFSDLSGGWLKSVGIRSGGNNGLHLEGISRDPFGDKLVGGDADEDERLFGWGGFFGGAAAD